jgi:hypothetical protein
MPNGALHPGAAGYLMKNGSAKELMCGERLNYVSIRFFLIFIDVFCRICFYGWYGNSWLVWRFETRCGATPESLGTSAFFQHHAYEQDFSSSCSLNEPNRASPWRCSSFNWADGIEPTAFGSGYRRFYRYHGQGRLRAWGNCRD